MNRLTAVARHNVLAAEPPALPPPALPPPGLPPAVRRITDDVGEALPGSPVCLRFNGDIRFPGSVFEAGRAAVGCGTDGAPPGAA